MCDGHNMFLSRREDKTKQVRRAFSEGSVHHRPTLWRYYVDIQQ